jgi:hypothetical protein
MTRRTPTRSVARRPNGEEPAFFRRVLEVLREAGIPFAVGGAYALEHHTGIHRDTSDFDVFVLPEDSQRILSEFARHGFRTELTFPHWLGKIFHRRRYVDVIFNSGNGVVRVDRAWFEHALPAELWGERVLVCPIEEMIWSKSFVMERERFDGADVLHLIRAGGGRLDWDRLLARFGSMWRVLLAHLVLFGIVYPNERSTIPNSVLTALAARLDEPDLEGPRVCFGTLLSRSQYLADLESGYRDGRIVDGIMSPEDVERWTDAGREHG